MGEFLSDAALAFVAGWFAGACQDAWPATPPGLPWSVEKAWNAGVYDGRLSRIEARARRRVKP